MHVYGLLASATIAEFFAYVLHTHDFYSLRFEWNKKLIQNYINCKVCIPGFSECHVYRIWSEAERSNELLVHMYNFHTNISIWMECMEYSCDEKRETKNAIDRKQAKAINVVDSFGHRFSQIDREKMEMV